MSRRTPNGRHRGSGWTRRRVVGSGLGAGLTVLLGPLLAAEAQANADRLAAAIQDITNGTAVKPGRVRLDIPALAENGYSVPLTVNIESPMTAADHVKAVHVLSEKNPVAQVVQIKVGPRAGRARFSTSIRLADTQQVTAIAEMSDGSFWSGTASVLVTLSACIDGG